MKQEERLNRYELRKMCQSAKKLIQDTLILLIGLYLTAVLAKALHTFILT